MGGTYAKLDSAITESTLWSESSDIRIVWITMLAMKDARGCVYASIPGLAHRARVPLDACQEALKKFMSPDPWSRTKDHDGRRIVEIDGGWFVLNHFKYRDAVDDGVVREQNRIRKQKQRSKNINNDELESRDVTLGHAMSRDVTPSDTDTDTYNNKNHTMSSKLDDVGDIFEFWKVETNHPKAILDAKREKVIRARLKEGYTVDRIKAAIVGIKKSPHHMGKNDRNTVYDDIELICRSGANVDKFADMGIRSQNSPPANRQQEILEGLKGQLAKGGQNVSWS